MDTLVSLPRNPVPTGAFVGRFEARDGVGLRYGRWRGALKEQKGTVCLFGGRGEYIEKYFETIADLRRRGFAVAIMDWRGQGGSDRLLADPRKGHVEDFADYERDLDQFMTEIVLPDCPPPYFGLSHSMGGNILLRVAQYKNCWFSRMVLCAPMVQLAWPAVPLPLLAAASEVAVLLGFGDSFVPGGSDRPTEMQPEALVLLTSDEKRLARNRAVLEAAPELAVGSPTLSWLRAAAASMRLIDRTDFPASVQVPLLMVAAGDDRIVATRAIEQLALQLKAGDWILLPSSRHEILQERDDLREQYWAAFDAFVPGS